MVFETYSLKNGIRIVHGRNTSPVAYCSITINAGTRDELDKEHGIAHFIEHVIFKGTKRRKAYHITSRLEDVGGELNAYTTKEETVVHAMFLKEDFHRAVELLYDIVFRSTFPEKELAKEKDVILDEINSYKDSPAELIFDDFEELLYPHHPFGRNILGTKRYIKGFTKDDIDTFIKRNYNTDQIVFCSIGDIPFKRVIRLAQRYFGLVSANLRTQVRTPIIPAAPKYEEVKKSTYQKHCMIGSRTYDLKDDNRIGMFLLTNILGGPGQNSRLNLALRERNGLAYNVEASYSPYSDTGVFSVYFGTDKANFERALNLVYAEMKNLSDKRLGVLQLAKAKKQLIGQLAIAAENSEALMLNAARTFMFYNSIDSLSEINARIEAISSDYLLHIANEILDEKNLSTLIYK
ncbi:MAG: pitrilysin family protein [Bacteroidales bacterium]|nr:pitrilysin family protein [Bacteroidales bacterium]MDD3890901.1 pitrilysin family protein [Bacteroidales bacterium]